MIGKEVLNQLTAYKQGMQIQEVKRKYQIDKIVKLASNENPYGFSKQVSTFFSSMEQEFEIYPDGYAYDLRVSLAEKLKVNESQLVFGGGSDEVITLICRAFLHEGTNTIMAAPTFSQYRHHALIEGAKLKEVPTVNGKHDLPKMAQAIDEQTKVVWLCTPDNPTGEMIVKEQFEAFMQQCPRDVIVVVDEAYYEFVAKENQFDLNRNLAQYDNLIVLRTFSKIYGLAGLRVGYGIANETIAEKLNIVRGPFNVSSIAQRAAVIALDDEQFVQTTKKLNDQVKQAFQQFLDEINWKYYETHTNFILVETPIDADEASLYLLKHGFIVRPGTLLGYPDTMRITIGKEEDMLQLQTIIKKMQDEIR
ncbi:histidinol-phosphate transaminase [Pseudogracilibacillus auburnensis]|uniref:Histidinol-phosphate aminotransferase n=1 Tax=Pseudogracilibacillus auburnensis TaxID=1494959 RepID=A0A2V3WIZ0_9BACI|nr:histidinol-phosphate transaminase [Pseudogracilibacillus auburnensis]PXW88749.1 histidinol-phosphate aminotransferase [Pseudogracilibacillus auburnensis]